MLTAEAQTVRRSHNGDEPAIAIAADLQLDRSLPKQLDLIFWLLDEFFKEDRGPRLGSDRGEAVARPGHSYIKQASLFCLRKLLGLRHDKLKQNVVCVGRGEAHLAAVGAKQDDMIPLEAL